MELVTIPDLKCLCSGNTWGVTLEWAVVAFMRGWRGLEMQQEMNKYVAWIY